MARPGSLVIARLRSRAIFKLAIYRADLSLGGYERDPSSARCENPAQWGCFQGGGKKVRENRGYKWPPTR